MVLIARNTGLGTLVTVWGSVLRTQLKVRDLKCSDILSGRWRVTSAPPVTPFQRAQCGERPEGADRGTWQTWLMEVSMEAETPVTLRRWPGSPRWTMLFSDWTPSHTMPHVQ